MNIFRLLLCTLCLTLLSGEAYAQLESRDTKVSGELIAESAIINSGNIGRLALYMTPQPGWHGYWMNGGDAGYGMRIKWQLPDGVRLSEGHYPIPTTYILQGLMNHVYEQPYAILFDVEIDDDLKPGTVLPIRASAQWLACSDKVCLPQQGTFETALTVSPVAGTEKRDARFDDWLAKLPSDFGGGAHYQLDGDTLRLSIPYPVTAPLSEPHFFTESEDMVDYAASQDFERRGDLLLIELKADSRANRPEALRGLLKIAPDRGLSIIAKAGQVPTLSRAAGTTSGKNEGIGSLVLIFLAAFLGGLILNVMPCVFPILGLKAISLAKAGGNERTARREALGYTGGVIAMALVLGAILLLLRAAGEQVGWAFQLQNPAVIFFLLLLMAAITANLLGLFELPGGNFAQSTNMRSSFATGALAAFVATPCTGPFMAAALGAALLLPWPVALMLFFALGLGLAFPFLAIGYSKRLRSMLPRPGPWLGKFRRWMALPMALTLAALIWLWIGIGGNLWLLVGALMTLIAILWVSGRAQRKGRVATFYILVAGLLLWCAPALVAAMPDLVREKPDDAYGDIAFSQERLDNFLAGEKPVFLYFTADWCITCKANEAAALDTDEVRAAFEKAGIVVMRADYTRPDSEIARFLSKMGRAGVPLYIYFPPPPRRGNVQILPQILTPSMLVELSETQSHNISTAF